MKLKSLIGTKSFYKRILSLSIPVMIQTGITNLVSLLDNVMVGSLGTEALSAVSIVNQFVFIFNLVIFGATAAAGTGYSYKGAISNVVIYPRALTAEEISNL